MANPGIRRFGQACLAGLLLMLGTLQSGVFAGDPDTDQQGGIAGTGIVAMGPIQRFGSIFINGREIFLKDNVPIQSEDGALHEKELHLGDVVTVDTRISSDGKRSEARAVTVQVALRGRVESVNAGSGALQILGQTVVVPPDAFGSTAKRADLSRIRVGDMLSVSGLMRADGSWTATRVGTAPDSASFVLRGTVRNLDRKQGTVRIGDTSVSLPAGVRTRNLRPGQIVRITGHYQSRNTLQATRVSVDRLVPGAGMRIEMSGYIQAVPAPGTAICNGVELRFGTATSTIGGAMTSVAVGMPVTVRGTVNATGGITVQEMVLRSEFLHVNLPRQIGMGPASAHGRSQRETPPGQTRPEIERPTIQRPQIERPNLPPR